MDETSTEQESTEPAWPPVDPPARAGGATDDPSATDAAKAEAAAVTESAAAAGKDVVETGRAEAGKVAGETKRQAKSLFASVTDEVSAQAGAQQQRVASQVESLSRELSGMASGSSESGPLTDLAQQAGQRGGEIATWLGEHEPRDVLREVQSFARRRPVTFLVLCGLAGVVAGRLTRGAVAANTELDAPKLDAGRPSPSRSTPEPSRPAPDGPSFVEGPALGESPGFDSAGEDVRVESTQLDSAPGSFRPETDRPGALQ